MDVGPRGGCCLALEKIVYDFSCTLAIVVVAQSWNVTKQPTLCWCGAFGEVLTGLIET